MRLQGGLSTLPFLGTQVLPLPPSMIPHPYLFLVRGQENWFVGVFWERLPESFKNSKPPIYFPIQFSFPYKSSIYQTPQNVSNLGKTAKYYIGFLEVNIVNKVISINRVK